VGDTVKMSGHTGVVEEVGLRTCRVRTIEGTLVTVPNANLVGGVVENLSARSARRFAGELGLVYSTTGAELKAAIAAVKEILAANPKVRSDFAVRFMKFADSALVVEVVYWVVPPDDYLDVVADVNLAIKERFEADGFDLAYPSMTIYRGDVGVGSGNGDHAHVN
jgi:MscS family membrane protein